MCNVTKLLTTSVITGVLVAFLFIAVETFQSPVSSPVKQNTLTSHSQDDTSIPCLSKEDSPLTSYSQDEAALSCHSERSEESFSRLTQNSIQSPPRTNDSAKRKLATANSPQRTLATDDWRLTTANKHLNSQTDNMNVLFIGVDQGKLLACSIFTINHQDKLQAGGVFVPTFARPLGYNLTFAQIYEKLGVKGLKKVLEKEMEIKIEIYYAIEREILKQIEKYINPIYIAGKQVELYNLFTMAATPEDEKILGALVRELTSPKVFFTKLPLLLADAKKYISTDFKINPKNLLLHYRIITGIDNTKVKKIILPTQKKIARGKLYHEIHSYHLQNTIYEITK